MHKEIFHFDKTIAHEKTETKKHRKLGIWKSKENNIRVHMQIQKDYVQNVKYICESFYCCSVFL